jgi:protein SCO1/2
MQIIPQQQRGRSLAPILLAVAALVTGVLLAAFLRQPPPPPALSQGTTQLQPPRPLGDFVLTDHTGNAFTLERLRGRWTFMFFGYTHCPDICPTTMSTLNAVARAIAGNPDTTTPQYVFVSIDPERDTPEQLARFVPYFNPSFLGVTGEPAAINALTRQLSVLYLKVEPERSEGYLMDHSAAILLLDPEGRFHALMSPPFVPAGMAQDFQKLADYFEENR